MNSPALFVRVGNRYRPATQSHVCEAATAYCAKLAERSRVSLTSPGLARNFLMSLSGLDHEVFGVLHLDNRHRLIEWEPLFRGTVDGASVHPREVAKSALAKGSVALILVHNHPSGVLEPSRADEVITERLRDALAMLDIRVVDHLIFAGGSVVSMAERGLV